MVIAGGGPVGLMLACELGLAGVDVLVIERLTSIDPTMKAGYVNLATAQAFYRRGMLPQLQERHDAAVERMQKFLASKGIENAVGGGPVGAHFSGIVLDIGLVDFTGPMFMHAGPAAGVARAGRKSEPARGLLRAGRARAGAARRGPARRSPGLPGGAWVRREAGAARGWV